MEWVESKEVNRVKNSKLVKCIAEIRKNSTGEVREYKTDEVLKNGEIYPSVFNWKESNFSCDCNRLLFFKESKDEMVDNDLDADCSIGKYSVNLKNKKDGQIYYREF